jgi:hypothetical protein
MSGDMPPLPQYALMVWCSVKAQVQLSQMNVFSAKSGLRMNIFYAIKCNLPLAHFRVSKLAKYTIYWHNSQINAQTTTIKYLGARPM